MVKQKSLPNPNELHGRALRAKLVDQPGSTGVERTEGVSRDPTDVALAVRLHGAGGELAEAMFCISESHRKI